jgi:hypothetical protein
MNDNYTKINSGLDYTEYLNDAGYRHRIDGPAFEWWNTSRNFPGHSFWVNGKRHKVGGPANIHFHKNGIKYLSEWYKMGKCHRLNAPAIISQTNITRLFWYEFGIEIKEISY